MGQRREIQPGTAWVLPSQCKTKLTSFPGRHEGYYISKANQTVRLPSGERFEFLAGELVNLFYSHKVCLSLRHTWHHQLTTAPVQRTGRLHIVHEGEPSSNPALDGHYLSLLPLASRETAVYLPSPQISRRNFFLKPFLRPFYR